jgi:5-oxoprolinase (ATP-hydrolysing) subunit B
MGESAIVFTTGGLSLAVQRRLWEIGKIVRTWAHVREAVVGDGNLTLIFDRHGISYDALAERLHEAWNGMPIARAPVENARAIEIPVRYGGDEGPDLAGVARACDLSPSELIERHAARAYVVSFIGFLPGFGYLDGLDPRLELPRRTQPRARVPAGSVAIAGRYSGIYPLDSPGGWHLIGHTSIRLFDPRRDPFTLLEAGDTVRFVPQ